MLHCEKIFETEGTNLFCKASGIFVKLVEHTQAPLTGKK
jgi:hypothetical protein